MTPCNWTNRTSYSRTACSAMWKDPSHDFSWVCRSITSGSHVRHTRCRTPRYRLCGGGGAGRSGKPASLSDGAAAPRWRSEEDARVMRSLRRGSALRMAGGERRPREPAMAAAVGVREWWLSRPRWGLGGQETEEGAERWGFFTPSPSNGVLLLHQSGKE
ncbi:hypothetical protein VPH35_037650 [Triticum aestivum]